MPIRFPQTDQPPRLPDGRDDRPGGTDPGRSAPDPGPGRPEELRADRGQGRLGHPHFPARRHRPPGVVRPQAVRPDRVSRRAGIDRHQDRRRAVLRDAAADGPGCRQDHGHPLDDARRGGPRARHAQHVHGLSSQPGSSVSEHGERGLPRIRPQEQSAALRLRSQPAQRVCRHRLSELVVLAVQPGQRPGRRRVSRFTT